MSVNNKKPNLAVAIDYDPRKMNAPVLGLAGVEEIAKIMKKVALRYGIPIEENQELAKKLLALEANGEIPEGCYEEIAQIIVKLSKEELV